MKNRSTVTVAELQAQTPKVMRQTQRRGMLAVTLPKNPVGDDVRRLKYNPLGINPEPEEKSQSLVTSTPTKKTVGDDVRSLKLNPFE